MQRRRVCTEGVSEKHVCAVVLDTTSVPGSKCDVRYDPDTNMYDLGDVATACFKSNRKASNVLRQWCYRKERGGVFSDVDIPQGEESSRYWVVTDEHNDDKRHRPSLRVVVSLRVACTFLAHCQVAHEGEPRLTGMRRLLSSRSSAALSGSARALDRQGDTRNASLSNHTCADVSSHVCRT